MNYLMQVQSNKVWRMNVTTYDQEWNLLLLDNELYIGSVMCLFGLTFCVLRRRWYTIDMSILKSLVLCILIEWRSGRLSDDWLRPLPQLMIGPLPQSVHPVWSRRVHSWSRPLPCWSLARADSTGSSSVCRKSPPGPACPLAHRTRFECRHRQTSTLAVKTCCRMLHVVYTCTCRLWLYILVCNYTTSV